MLRLKFCSLQTIQFEVLQESWFLSVNTCKVRLGCSRLHMNYPSQCSNAFKCIPHSNKYPATLFHEASQDPGCSHFVATQAIQIFRERDNPKVALGFSTVEVTSTHSPPVSEIVICLTQVQEPLSN